ncbi:MAG TPA: porin, partial [Methylophilaceae bacterium]|nr:porin [Methylophilaceae bacterium]
PGVGGNLTTGDELLYAGRIQYDFWTPNGAPAYYTGSTTFGAVDVLSIGVAAQYQKDGSVSTTKVGDYTGWNIDALLEKKLGDSGAVTLEAAYYEYDTDGVITSEDGNAYLAGIGYIFSDKVGWGQFQPYFRYQKFEPDNNIETKQYDYGVNYVIDSFNAKVSATYSKTEVTATPDVDKFVVGLQLQF